MTDERIDPGDRPGVRDLWIAYGGDPDEYDRMVERYLNGRGSAFDYPANQK